MIRETALAFLASKSEANASDSTLTAWLAEFRSGLLPPPLACRGSQFTLVGMFRSLNAERSQAEASLLTLSFVQTRNVLA